MSPERKIDLSTYNGPMTVVGYPDFSAAPAPATHQESQLFPSKSHPINGNNHEHKHHHHKKKK